MDAFREHIRGGRKGEHDVDLDRNRAMGRMLFPAVGEDAGFDDLLDDDFWLQLQVVSA